MGIRGLLWRAWMSILLTLPGTFLINVGVIDYELPLAQRVATSLNLSGRVSITALEQALDDLEYDRINTMYNQLERKDIDVVIGYPYPSLGMATEKLQIPLITTVLSSHGYQDNRFFLLPSPDQIVSAAIDVIKSYGWSTVGVVYETTLDHQVLTSLVNRASVDLKFWKLTPSASKDDLRQLVLDMRSRDLSEFILITRTSVTRKIFQQARRLGIIARPFAWLVINLGCEDVWSGVLEDLHTNLTLLTLMSKDAHLQDEGPAHRLSEALMTDALQAVDQTSRNIRHSGRKSVRRGIQEVSFSGETGHVDFALEGGRHNFSLLVYNYNGWNLTKVAEWDSVSSVFDSPLRPVDPGFFVEGRSRMALFGKKIKVVTIIEKPFTMLKEDHENLHGNDKYEGFSIDMIKEIAEMLHFEYEIYLVHDGKFGRRTPTGEWNGVMGEILSGNATLSIAPLSINAEREAVVDFTKPFKNRGITVLMKTPEIQTRYFQFMDPLSPEVWLCILLTLVFMGFTIFVLEKMSFKIRTDMPKLNIMESFWFILGSLVSGSTESSPVTIPSRVLTSAWWFFALILVSTYTANLAAFLTVKKINPPISSVLDLIEQSKIKYGTVRNSGAMAFFETTKLDPFSKMWAHMSEISPESMVESTEEGLRRAKTDNYAFLWDETVNTYAAQVDCGVTQVGPPFDPKGIGIAVPPGAIYRDDLSMAILELADLSRFNELNHKWWEQQTCPDHSKPSTDETSELSLENVAGIFFVLLGGMMLAVVAFVFEKMVCSCRKEKKGGASVPDGHAQNSPLSLS